MATGGDALKNLKLLLLIFIGSLNIQFKTLGAGLISATRNVDESWQVARQREMLKIPHKPMQGFYQSAEIAAKPWLAFNSYEVKEWPSYQELKRAFEFVRDYEFLIDPIQFPAFTRRVTWLYPDDGCYIRAALARQLLKAANFKELSRIFIFGNLSVRSNNSPNGWVNWWYHTALAARVGSQVYIFDPAINYHEPMKVQDWVSAQGKNYVNSFKVSTCKSTTFLPNSNCLVFDEQDDEVKFEWKTELLRLEWRRQLLLGRDPSMVLGPAPPWISVGDLDHF